jgi:glyoxylase-like metal-dependent hydrolase (beta-lactamase superfamily II)
LNRVLKVDLVRIKGSTYYLPGPTNSGVYVFENKECLLIDPGINNSRAKRIEEVLAANGLYLKYIINTHAHLDHCGGNIYLKKAYPDCLVCASGKEKIFMENPFLLTVMLYSAKPLRGLERSPRRFPVDVVLKEGSIRLQDQTFEIIPLAGHTWGQIGVITPERVCFVGDSVFSHGTLDKYSLPYLFDVEESVATLNYLREIDASSFLIAHDEQGIISREEMASLVARNLANIDKYLQQILKLLDRPLSREEVLKNLVIVNGLKMNLMEYHLLLSTVSAFIKHLNDGGLITYSIEDGNLFYCHT